MRRSPATLGSRIALLIALTGIACAPKPPAASIEGARARGVYALDSLPLHLWGEADGVRLATVSGMALLTDGSVVVADASGPVVYLLSGQGDSTRQLGRAGSGPGEYRRPEVLGTTDDGLIVIRDMQQFRVLYWRADGSLNRSTGPGGKIDGVIWTPVGVLGQGELVTSEARYGAPGPPGSLRRLEAAITITNASGNAHFTIGTFPFADFISLYLPVGSGQMIQGPQYFGWKLHVAAGPQFVAVGAGGDHEIRCYGPTGDLLGTITVADKRLPLSDAERNAFIERAKSQVQFAVTSASFAPERFADSLPVFGGILASNTGIVWVVAPSWAGHTAAYMKAYTLRGTLVGELPLPAGFTPLAANDSVVGGYLVDSTDVPTVVTYRLRFSTRSEPTAANRPH